MIKHILFSTLFMFASFPLSAIYIVPYGQFGDTQDYYDKINQHNREEERQELLRKQVRLQEESLRYQRYGF